MLVSILDIISNISFIGWSVVVGSIFTAILSGIVFWQDITKRNGKFFFIFGIANAVWGLAYAFFEGSFGTLNAYLGIMLLYLTAAFMPVFSFLFIYVFSVEKVKLSKLKLLAFFAPSLMFAGVLIFYPNIIVGYRPILGAVSSKMIFGKGFIVYTSYIIIFLIAGIALLAKKYRDGAGIFKVAVQELLFAVSFACGLAILTSLLSPLFIGGHDLIWVGHMSVTMVVFITALILSKYNFWNAKIIATELFISVIIFVLIAELFIAGTFLDLIIKTAITILILFSSSFLVGSVKREIQSKNKISQLLQDLELASRRLKVLDKKKSEFLSISSHHLRDPLTAIKGYASMLSEGSFGDLPLGVREAVEKIFASSGHLITMISDFMDISHIESGDMNYNFKDVDMRKLVKDIAGEMKQNVDRARLKMSVVIDDGVEDEEQFVTVGDEGKLRQVISNLIDNAIKYTPRGEISLLLCKSPDKKKILFSLSDTGIGMSESTKEKIFRKFSRADGVSKVYTEGTGLGLYVAKEIVKKHEGNIWADSRGEGQGSTFFVEIEVKG